MACDIAVGNNSNISRRHAAIFLEQGRTFIMDSGSANGTFVFGSRLVSGERALLVSGTEVSLADERFVFHER